MDPAYFHAVAALAAASGGLAAAAISWVGHSDARTIAAAPGGRPLSVKSSTRILSKRHRGSMPMRSRTIMPNFRSWFGMYALIGRMKIISSDR